MVAPAGSLDFTSPAGDPEPHNATRIAEISQLLFKKEPMELLQAIHWFVHTLPHHSSCNAANAVRTGVHSTYSLARLASLSSVGLSTRTVHSCSQPLHPLVYALLASAIHRLWVPWKPLPFLRHFINWDLALRTCGIHYCNSRQL
jgi:hypothetical protein